MRCLYRVPEFPQDSCGLLRYVTDRGGDLTAAPPLTAFLDMLLPVRVRVELAFTYQELDEVFQAGPEAASAQRYVQRRHVVRVLVPSLR
jgi:hypothetical protein